MLALSVKTDAVHPPLVHILKQLIVDLDLLFVDLASEHFTLGKFIFDGILVYVVLLFLHRLGLQDPAASLSLIFFDLPREFTLCSLH